jgi:hypothetical protein
MNMSTKLRALRDQLVENGRYPKDGGFLLERCGGGGIHAGGSNIAFDVLTLFRLARSDGTLGAAKYQSLKSNIRNSPDNPIPVLTDIVDELESHGLKCWQPHPKPAGPIPCVVVQIEAMEYAFNALEKSADDEDAVTASEAAQTLGIGISHVYRQVKAGKLVLTNRGVQDYQKAHLKPKKKRDQSSPKAKARKNNKAFLTTL